MNSILALIKNFTKKELSCRCGCGLFNYDPNFLIRLQAFRLILRKALTPTRGCSCVEHNRDVKGVATSLHEGETKEASAADVTNGDCGEIFRLACISGLFNEVEWHKTDGLNFVHLGWDPNQKGNSFKTI